MRKKVKKLKVSGRSSLVIGCDCVVEDVEVDGHEEISKEGDVSVKNDSKKYKELVATEGNEEPHLIIRKYKIKE